jgi:acylphosphatase
MKIILEGPDKKVARLKKELEIRMNRDSITCKIEKNEKPVDKNDNIKVEKPKMVEKKETKPVKKQRGRKSKR